MSSYGFVRVGCATPKMKVADVKYNLAEMLRMCEKAAEEKVQMLVFPELAITGYT